jgi:predicted membrane channel-forming protein YqfA (hemolysin III family)
MNNLQKPKKKLDDFVHYSGMAFEMAAIMGFGTWLGVKIDHWFELSFPAFTLALLILSFVGAIYHVIRKLL